MINVIEQAKLMELFEIDFDRLILVGHKQGLSYPQLFYCILHRLEAMILQCSAEEWLKDGE